MIRSSQSRCLSFSLTFNTRRAGRPGPALAVRFLQPEDDPFEDLYAAGAREAPIGEL